MNLSRETFAEVMDMAEGKTLNPPFDLYANGLINLLASFAIPTVGLTTYVFDAQTLVSSAAKTVSLLILRMKIFVTLSVLHGLV